MEITYLGILYIEWKDHCELNNKDYVMFYDCNELSGVCNLIINMRRKLFCIYLPVCGCHQALK